MTSGNNGSAQRWLPRLTNYRCSFLMHILWVNMQNILSLILSKQKASISNVHGRGPLISAKRFDWFVLAIMSEHFSHKFAQREFAALTVTDPETWKERNSSKW